MRYEVYTGTVAKTYDGNPEKLDIIIQEKTPFISGEINPTVRNIALKLNDPDSKIETEKLKETKNTIEAYWINKTFHGNPPYVVVGETVFIYQIGSIENYYWESSGRQDNLRDVDTFSLFISAKPKRDIKELTEDNSYTFSINPREKQVRLTTSDFNGESSIYNMVFNGEKGQFYIKDNHSNFISLDSVEKVMKLKNGDDTILTLNKDVATLQSRRAIHLASKTITAEFDYLLLSGNDSSEAISIETKAKNTSIRSSKNIELNSKNLGVRGQSTFASSIGCKNTVAAKNFYTGAAGGFYTGTSINAVEGKSTEGNSESHPHIPSETNRESTAWPEMHACVDYLIRALRAVNAPENFLIEAERLMDEAIMHNLKGE